MLELRFEFLGLKHNLKLHLFLFLIFYILLSYKTILLDSSLGRQALLMKFIHVYFKVTLKLLFYN